MRTVPCDEITSKPVLSGAINTSRYIRNENSKHWYNIKNSQII